MTFGPGSVCAGKKNENKKESISRTASSSNMFLMLNTETVEPVKRMFMHYGTCKYLHFFL
jgi:translation initiation factor 4G